MRSDSRARDADKLVIDASVALKAALVVDGFRAFRAQLIAPSLLWSEVAAGLRQLEWRREISSHDAQAAMERLLVAGIEETKSAGLIGEAGDLARELGWAKTYDAEYVVLARRTNSALITVDARLRRGVAHIVEIKGPTDIVTEAEPTLPLLDSGQPDQAHRVDELLEGFGER